MKMEKHLVKITARVLNENPRMVAGIIDCYEKFISDTIRKGKFENVRVPLFGIFRVNLKKLKYYIEGQSKPEVIIADQNPPHEETIYNG